MFYIQEISIATGIKGHVGTSCFCGVSFLSGLLVACPALTGLYFVMVNLPISLG